MTNIVAKPHGVLFNFFTFFYFFVKRRKRETPLFPVELNIIDIDKFPHEITDGNRVLAKNKKEERTIILNPYLNLFVGGEKVEVSC